MNQATITCIQLHTPLQYIWKRKEYINQYIMYFYNTPQTAFYSVSYKYKYNLLSVLNTDHRPYYYGDLSLYKIMYFPFLIGLMYQICTDLTYRHNQTIIHKNKYINTKINHRYIYHVKFNVQGAMVKDKLTFKTPPFYPFLLWAEKKRNHVFDA